MGKKTRQVAYDKNALLNLANHIKRARQPLKENGIPELKIDLGGLETVIKELPKKEREVTEKVWGLIPGTVIQAKNVAARIQKDIAFKDMLERAYKIIEKLFSMEYLIQYDLEARKVAENFYRKFDKTGCEELTDVDALKYFLIFLVFLAGGPKMIYESEQLPQVTEEEEKVGYFDQYSLLTATWNGSAMDFPDKSIRIKLIILFLEMLDFKDVLSMKQYVGLPIEKEYENWPTESVIRFREIRQLKEKIFPSGSWETSEMFIYGHNVDKKQIEKFCSHFSNFRKDWTTVNPFRKGEDSFKVRGKTIKLPRYEIEGFYFNDIYEIMFLYLSRRYLE